VSKDAYQGAYQGGLSRMGFKIRVYSMKVVTGCSEAHCDACMETLSSLWQSQ